MQSAAVDATLVSALQSAARTPIGLSVQGQLHDTGYTRAAAAEPSLPSQGAGDLRQNVSFNVQPHGKVRVENSNFLVGMPADNLLYLVSC
jgi:hypothetical protein